MRMLIIGDANSLWIKTTIENTIDTEENQVLLISYGNDKYSDWYESRGIRVLLIPQNHYGKLNMFVSAKQVYNKIKHEKFDLLIIHFVSRAAMVMGLCLKLLALKSVAAFWGSDIFRASKSTTLFFRFALRTFDCINITTDAMLEKFHQMYGYSFDKKITRARFGINSLNYLKNDSQRLSRFDEIPSDKVVTAVGYNGHLAQQHIQVINELRKLPAEVLAQIHLVFRMTYGGNAEYVKKIKAEVKSLGCTYSIYTEFLSDEESVCLTALTDIFIHAQKTDALSACMLEHLYSGAQVFNPTWIPYLELQHPSVFYLKYSSFGELGDLLQTNLIKKEQYDAPMGKMQMRGYIERLASWKYLKADWQKIYYGES
ncbi:MAG: glycosyltransferase [Oscillospiraceae bacterium]|nr:glycosyltransferase [Oscillospiraceae bacterium]